MLYNLIYYFKDFLQAAGLWKYANVFRYLTFRSGFAVVTSFCLCMMLAPVVIRLLRRLKVGGTAEFGHEVVDRMYASKAGTPTMGGLLIVLTSLVSAVLWADMTNFYIHLAIFTVVWLGALGFVDDYLKMVPSTRNRTAGAEPRGARDGLKMWEKFVFQIALAVILGGFLYHHWTPPSWAVARIITPEGGPPVALNLPFYKFPITLSVYAFMVVSVLVIAGTSNAVNLADGMDGLATGCIMPIVFVFLALAYIAGNAIYSDYLFVPFVRGAGELSVFCGALLGACLGFLWYNCYPAEVFMGDTGSLPLGGAIGYLALVTRQEALLFIVGGVFVLEALSVILQVGYFKVTGGKRIFLMSPLHYHFQLKGWTETQTVVRFWLIGVMCAALALASLKLR